MLPFGEATSPCATTVPRGMEVNVGLGSGVLTGPGVAACEIAGSGGVDGRLGGLVVGLADGVPDVACVACGEWLRITCAAAFVPAGKHPASMVVTATLMPTTTKLRFHVALVVASALPRFALSNMIPPRPNPSRGYALPI